MDTLLGILVLDVEDLLLKTSWPICTKNFCKKPWIFSLHKNILSIFVKKTLATESCVGHLSFHKRLPNGHRTWPWAWIFVWLDSRNNPQNIKPQEVWQPGRRDQGLWPWFPWRTTFCMWSSCDSNIHRPHTQHLHQHVNNAIRGLNLLVRFGSSPVPSCC